MKKFFLMWVALMPLFAANATADMKNTNFDRFHYLRLHSMYYTEDNSFYADQLVYTVTAEGEVAVSGADINATELEIPSEVTQNGKTYKVTSIHGYAFYRLSQLKSITLPETLEYIYTSTLNNRTIFSHGPFFGCKNLKTIICKAMKAPRFWNEDTQGRNLMNELNEGITIKTPEGSDYTAWAPFVNGLELHVSIPASGYGSFYLNKSLKLGSEANLIIMKQVGNNVNYETLNEGYIPAETAIIIKAKAGSYVTLTTSEIPDGTFVETEGNLLQGWLTNGKCESQKYFGLSDRQSSTEELTFETINLGGKLMKNKAYLPGQYLSLSGFNITENAGTDGRTYNLDGRSIKADKSKGIQIQKGKKEYIK